MEPPTDGLPYASSDDVMEPGWYGLDESMARSCHRIGSMVMEPAIEPVMPLDPFDGDGAVVMIEAARRLPSTSSDDAMEPGWYSLDRSMARSCHRIDRW